MEFRLSENTVNSYNTYTTERDKYKTGANPGGGWLPLKDWLVSEKFSCSWSDGYYTTDLPRVPTKQGSTALWQAISSEALKTNGLTGGIIGVHGGADNSKSGDDDGNGYCAVGITPTYGSSAVGDQEWEGSVTIHASPILKILLVRPYL